MTIVSPASTAPTRHPSGRTSTRRRTPRTNVIAVAAAVSGLVLFLVPIVPLLLGGIARGQIRRSGDRGLVMAGFAMVVGVVGSAVWIAFWLLVLLNKGVNVPLTF